MSTVEWRDTSILDQPERLYVVRRVLPLIGGVSSVFDNIAATAATVARTPIALISIIDHEVQRFAGRYGTDLESTHRDDALCSLVVQESELIVADTSADDRFATNPLVAPPFNLRSYAGTPLVVNGCVLGAVCVIDAKPRVFDEKCMETLRMLAATTASVLDECAKVHTVDLTSETEPQAQEPIEEPSDHLPGWLQEQVLTVLDQAVVVTDLDNQIVWANDASRQLFGRRATTGIWSDRVPLDLPGLASTTARSPRHITERISPLVHPVHGEITGVIRSFIDITEGETERLRLERLVNTDPLTGVDNRRSFESQLRSVLDEMARTQSEPSVAVGILDLDRFKAVNDQLGHAVGDAVLVEIAQILRSHLRDEDVLARIGGDEFACVLPDVDHLTARSLLEGVLAAVEQAMTDHSDVRSETAASVGIAMLRVSDKTPADVLRRADIACYAAKQAGGSCIHLQR